MRADVGSGDGVPAGLARGRHGSSFGRVLLATLVFATLYVLAVPMVLLLVLGVFAWEMLRWLLFGAMLLPMLFGLGLIGLLKGAVPAGLLIGVIAARTPERHWPKLVAAVLLPLVDLLLFDAEMVPRLLERASLLLLTPTSLFVLNIVAPLAASLLAALLVPQRLVRRLLRA